MVFVSHGDAGTVDLTGRKALFIVDSPAALSDGETLVQEILQEQGMVVTLGPATGPASLATGQNVIVASDGATASDFATTFGTVAVPVIVFGNSHFQSLGWVAKSAKGTVDASAQLTITDDSTTLSSDLGTGTTFTAVLATTSASLYWGTPTGAPITVASVVGTPTEVVAFGFETGASTGSTPAPARRVGLGWKTNVIQNLTVDAYKLFQAALDWTAGAN